MKAFVVIGMLAIGGTALAAEPVAPAASARADVGWSNLSPGQQQLLEQFESNWDQLPLQRRLSLARGAERWLAMNQDDRRAARDRYGNWRTLSEDRRNLIRQRWGDFQSLSPAEQARIRGDYREFRRLSIERRAELRRQWQQKSQAERQQMLRDVRERRRQQRRQPN